MTTHHHWRLVLTVALACASALLAPRVDAQSGTTTTTTTSSGPARLTIAGGPVQVLRGAQRFEAREGLALADDDIVRTTATTTVARIEWPDGRALDLGPGTQALLPSAPGANAAGVAGAAALLLQGWAKLGAGGTAPARVALARAVLVVEPRGVVLVQAGADGSAAAFAESRRVAVTARAGAPGSSAETTLREGEGWRLEAGAASAAAGRVAPRSDALHDVPRALADALPRRLERVSSHDAPGDGEPLDAADLAAWQRAEPAWMAHAHPRNAAAAPRSSPARSTIARASTGGGSSSVAPRANRESRPWPTPPAGLVPSLPLPAPVSPTDFAPIEPLPALAAGAVTLPPQR